jgi:hypothetical protein
MMMTPKTVSDLRALAKAERSARDEYNRTPCSNSWQRLCDAETELHEAQRRDCTALLDRIEALEADKAVLRQFARDVLDSDRRYSIDGADVESLAQKHGLLVDREVTEACGESCVCADYGFPQSCLRFGPIISNEGTPDER